METSEVVLPIGLSICFGNHPPASASMDVIWPAADGGTRVVHLSLMDLQPFTDADTELTGPEVLNLIGRMVTRFVGVRNAAFPD